MGLEQRKSTKPAHWNLGRNKDPKTDPTMKAEIA
jgi:hypothetical protein